MKNELSIENCIGGLGYFFSERGDMKRYISYESTIERLKIEKPEIYLIILNYENAEKALIDMFKNNKSDWD